MTVSGPIDTPARSPPQHHLDSLDRNQLCGIGDYGEGTHTIEGITKLCEGLKGSFVTLLRCALGPSVCFRVSAY